VEGFLREGGRVVSVVEGWKKLERWGDWILAFLPYTVSCRTRQFLVKSPCGGRPMGEKLAGICWGRMGLWFLPCLTLRYGGATS